MAGEYIYTMYGMNRHFGPKHVLKNINLSFYHGAKIGIVGDNGAGKSTLLRIMAGLDPDFTGHAEVLKGTKVRLVEQEPVLEQGKTVREHLEMAVGPMMAMLKEYEEITEKMGEMDPDEMDRALEKMGNLQEKIENAGGWEIETQLSVAANALCLPPDEMVVDDLSGGEQRRVALCMALLEQPQLLLLDEPTNHLDAETVLWLENQLKEYPGTVIVSTHDRYFLDKVTKWILELREGQGIPFEGNYTSWLSQRLDEMAKGEKRDSSRKSAILKELEWIRMSSKDRREISNRRIRDYEQLMIRERSRTEGETTTIQIPSGDPLGDKVVVAKELTKSFGGNVLFKDLEMNMPKGAVVGIIGPNGAGKTTLFKMIMNQETADSGTLEMGDSVKPCWVEQFRTDLDREKTVYEEVSEGVDEIQVGQFKINARAYLGRFGFKGSDQQQKVGHLSGGSRNRLHLAKMLKQGGNLLLLDEPTNDLAIGILRLLEEGINDFSGCVMVISHDRFFLNRVCTHLLVFEGDARARWFEGNWEEYEAVRRKEIGDRMFENRRAKYRRFAL
ncbi:MAG: energy-dependent translational throttle protein EttA [Candidatus Wallbacteria bacterium HGW-Wallbacteria-1]|jgi:ATP-binding cassette ChvD family protein|uniref:Energy-dependent translational throttle protein EttA n=1 Tax=Candidatus Wallbacteria bacterium HGW-Wallbacteria-1 TaxID=2013854 RepID=A0A2N1PPT4_9BACT|nr:MAG: energy-dependent translational throttle protein EttA [Candidatus Wallbacteria bacterium HGW-Wallbacteria-1]